ncbi:hypothetical protein D3C73_928440 [compost metagenome]
MQAIEALVILAGQAFDVIAQRQDVLLDGDLADGLVFSRDVLLIGRQADLGVDHHLLVARQINDHVRLEALAVRPLEIDLSLVLAALLQPRMLEHALKNQLAPIALGLLPFQGAGQVGGFIAQAQIQLLQALQLLGQGETLTGLVLIAFLDTFFEGLDAFLEWIEQLPQALLAGFGKTLLALIENFPRQLGKLRAQLVSRTLQVVEALLMAVLLLAQFGIERRGLGIQTAQFGFFAGAFDIPRMGGVPGVVALDLQQFDFTTQRSQIGLFGGVGLGQISRFIAAGFELCIQSVLRQLRHGQAFLQQRDIGLRGAGPTLKLPGQYQQRQRSRCQTQQYAGQVHCHSHSCHSDKA